jgi:hypothetical protein
MTFPASPIDGQTAIVNGILYQYAAADNLWKRVPNNSGLYGNSNVSAYLAATYPIVYDGALRLGTATGPDIYFDAQNTIYVGHGGSNHTNMVVDAHPSFTGNATFSGNTTITGTGNLAIHNLSNITVESGGAIHLLSGAYLYGYDALFSNLTVSGNASVGNISATGFYFANGTPFVSSTYGNTDVAAYLLVDSTITGLQSNAAFQANLLDVLTGNAASQGSLLDILVANAAAQSANLTILLSNAAAQEASLTSLVSNAAAQSGAIDTISANVGAYQLWANANVNNLQNQITSANTTISLFQANVGSFYTWANLTYGTSSYANANVAAYLLTNTGNIAAGNIIAGGFYFANGTPFTSSNFGNTEVAAYLGPYYTYANANAAAQATGINDINANLGAYQTYANANAASQQTQIDSFNTNLGAYQTYANANAATQATGIDSINANLGAYQTYANANAAAQAGSISTLQTQVYSNVNTAAYLAGNVTTGNVFTNGLYYANGAPYGITVFDEGIPVANAITGINFVGSGVQATATGANLTVVVTGGGGGGGGSLVYTAATTPPAYGNNTGDQWYNTATDTLYEYIYDGVAYYWVDITTPVTGNVSTGYVNRKYTATGTGNTYTISTGCTVFNVMVYLNGVAQMPTDDYTISGTTLTVDGTPDAGTIVQIRELPR